MTRWIRKPRYREAPVSQVQVHWSDTNEEMCATTTTSILLKQKMNTLLGLFWAIQMFRPWKLAELDDQVIALQAQLENPFRGDDREA